MEIEKELASCTIYKACEFKIERCSRCGGDHYNLSCIYFKK